MPRMSPLRAAPWSAATVSVIEKFEHIYTSLLALAYFIVCKYTRASDEKEIFTKFSIFTAFTSVDNLYSK